MSQRKQRLEGEIGAFVRQFGRKKQGGGEPNDRRYDRKIEALISRMDPEELDELLHGEAEADLPRALGSAGADGDPEPA